MAGAQQQKKYDRICYFFVWGHTLFTAKVFFRTSDYIVCFAYANVYGNRSTFRQGARNAYSDLTGTVGDSHDLIVQLKIHALNIIKSFGIFIHYTGLFCFRHALAVSLLSPFRKGKKTEVSLYAEPPTG